MNDQTIQMIAQAIIANTKVIQSLIDSLPHETRAAVAEVANVQAPAPVVQAAQPVVQAAPNVAPVAPAMPAPPAFPAPTPAVVAPAPVAPAAPTPVAASPSSPAAPFADQNGLVQYIMASYQQMGPTKGAGIQGVLTQLGYANVNDIRPEHYGALFQGVEALKAA